jgi:Fe2+ or Zn2+ uptake regulation protein
MKELDKPCPMSIEQPRGENMTEQTQQLNRVAATTKEAILEFIGQRLNDAGSHGAFTADQLRFYVNNNATGGVSPSSADRVLRMLRQQGLLDYAVLNRGKSLYRALPLGTTHV